MVLALSAHTLRSTFVLFNVLLKGNIADHCTRDTKAHSTSYSSALRYIMPRTSRSPPRRSSRWEDEPRPSDNRRRDGPSYNHNDDRNRDYDRREQPDDRRGGSSRRARHDEGYGYGYDEREREKERRRDRERYDRHADVDSRRRSDRRSASPRRGPPNDRARSDSAPPEEVENKAKPNFKPSGLLAAETNTVKAADGTATVLKYNEPPEARKPLLGWRLYVFKGDEQLRACSFARLRFDQH